MTRLQPVLFSFGGKDDLHWRNGPSLQSHRQTGSGHEGFGLADGVVAELEEGGGENRAAAPMADAFDKMPQSANADRGDDRNRNGVRDCPRERNVEPRPRPVAIHGGQKDFASSERNHFASKFHGVDAGRLPAAMGENFPSRVVGVG